MDVYFLRHANAGNSVDDPEEDEKRPLDPLGVEQSQRMGRVLAALDVKLDSIISSPLVRAKQTAAHAAAALGYEKTVLLDNALRPDGKFDDFMTLLRRHAKADAIMVVGHNPSLSEFLSLLVSDEATPVTIDLKKGAVARLERKSRRSELQWILTPKLVQTIQEASATSSRPKTSRK